jgi:hypothetical protein
MNFTICLSSVVAETDGLKPAGYAFVAYGGSTYAPARGDDQILRTEGRSPIVGGLIGGVTR